MIYERIQKGRFLKRPNRFIAKIEINGKEETVHVKNTGRCAELLVPGAEVFVRKSESAGRKTGWDLISVRKADRLINMDSQVTNKVVQEWIEAGRWFKDVKIVRPEVTYKNSRFDLYVEYEEKKAFIEVKGVTLEEEGVVKFKRAGRSGAGWVRGLCILCGPDERSTLFYTKQTDSQRICRCSCGSSGNRGSGDRKGLFCNGGFHCNCGRSSGSTYQSTAL